jgi:hypothetical protein
MPQYRRLDEVVSTISFFRTANRDRSEAPLAALQDVVLPGFRYAVGTIPIE